MGNKDFKYTIETFEADPELKAHIYQQLAEFEPYLIPGSHISVSVHDKKLNKKTKSPSYIITLSLNADGGKIQAKGYGENMFDAATDAKNTLLRKFDNIQAAITNPAEREMEINSIVKNRGQNLLH